MLSMADIPAARRELIDRLFPEGVPMLWCPPLTHYTQDGAIDRQRIRAHLRFMATWVRGLLVPGSTGDAWELTPGETQELLGIVLDEVRGLGLHLLVGALRPEIIEIERILLESIALLRNRTGANDVHECLARARVCGFAVCPPRGEGTSRTELDEALTRLLGQGLPMALYQLPQETQNEMSPELIADLAGRFRNFILFKDTSGSDRVANSGLDFGGVWLMRGAEGNYAQSLKAGGGPYDGFLLSAANSFGAQLQQIGEGLAAGKADAARELSDRLTGLIDQVFSLVRSIPVGNTFANAGKAIDHFFALGLKAPQIPGPRLHEGISLTPRVLESTAAALERFGLMPAKGYLE